MPVKRKLPFEVSRGVALPLITQIVEGFRRAIECGVYPPGTALPTLSEVAEAAGVSMIVAVRAFRRLKDEGLVQSRPGIGTTVVDRGRRNWRGHVVMVSFKLQTNYYFANASAIMREKLHAEGYIVSDVSVVQNADGAFDFAGLERMLSGPVSLVVLFGDFGEASKKVSQSGIPFVSVGAPVEGVKGCVGWIGFDTAPAIAEFAAHCAASKIRKAVVVSAVYPKTASRVAQGVAELRKVGIEVEEWRVRNRIVVSPEDRLDNLAIRNFGIRLAKGKSVLPDIFFFGDDYIAKGALLALLGAGVRIPEDVKVVSWSNRGDGPFFLKRVTCIEADPIVGGTTLAGAVMSYLSGKGFPKDARLTVSYRIGETFPI